MTSLELRLYTAGHVAVKDIINWRNRKTALLKASAMYRSSSSSSSSSAGSKVH